MYGEKRLYPEAANATLNLKQTARRSSYLTFGCYVCANDIPTTRIEARSWRYGYQVGTPWHVFFVYSLPCSKEWTLLTFETNLLSVPVDRKLIRQGEYKEHRQKCEDFNAYFFRF